MKKKEPFLGMSLALRREHAILLIFMSLCLASMTQHHFVWDVFCNANVKYTSTFQCCYEQRLLFLSFPGHTRHRQHGLARHRHTHTQVQSTLTGYFMRSVLLVKGWTHCCLRNCFNSSWRTFIKVLETFHVLVHRDIMASRRCCRFVGGTSTMQISTASHRSSTGLRSGARGDHWSTVKPLSCSRHQLEMIWAVWHGALSCWR